MNTAELLNQATEAGIEMTLMGDRLRMRAPEKPPEWLVAALRERKREILEYLAARRHVYKYRLRGDEGGGLYLTDSGDLETARRELATRYGHRLALVTRS